MTQAIQDVPLGHYRVKHVVKSEVLKIFTLRSNAIIVGLTVVAGLLVTGLVTNAASHHGTGYYIGFDPTQNSLIGLIVAGLGQPLGGEEADGFQQPVPQGRLSWLGHHQALVH